MHPMSASSSSSTNNNNINNKVNRKHSESHASVSDLQGHRLSSYASSSLFPTQPQSLSPKLINSNLDSTSLLSINRFLEESSRPMDQLNNLNNPSEPKLNNIGTSPIRYNMSSPSFSHQHNHSSPKANNDRIPRRRSSSSPRKRSVSTRNAATSPNLDWRKISANDIRFPSKTTLENLTLEGRRPNKPLRTTRSLSPRPPVRHQHAIMVSDENDIISVKISPSEDVDRNNLSTGAVKKKIKSKSEHNSPNFYDNDSKFSYETKANIINKSTGCLVYVPSDPWMKMSDLENRNFNKNDPWISRPGLKQGSKSFSNTKFDFSEKAISSMSRPKLCRSKSPLHIDEDLPSLSPSSPFLSPPPPPPITPPCFKNNNSLSPIRNSFLDVSPNNVNMLQARHSFSSILQKDDELQLNIRRLSEQIKRKDSKPTAGGSDNIFTGASSGADFTEYLQQFHSSEARKAKAESEETTTANNNQSGSSKNLDSVLETTC